MLRLKFVDFFVVHKLDTKYTILNIIIHSVYYQKIKWNFVSEKGLSFFYLCKIKMIYTLPVRTVGPPVFR